MIRWLKYFFGCFFLDKLALEGEWRSLLNGLFSFLLALVLVAVGLASGYNLAFPMYYDKATEFQNFAVHAFDNDNLALKLVEEEGENFASSNIVVNTYGNEADKAAYAKNGYSLIIDTRPIAEKFYGFTVTCYDKDGKPVGDYAPEQKAEVESGEYTFKFDYTTELLDADIEANYQTYFNFLTECTSNEEHTNYNQEIANQFKDLNDKNNVLAEGLPSYKRDLYVLYVWAYYPSLVDYEGYSYAPTVQGYYDSLVKTDTSGKRLLVYRDRMQVNFTSGNVALSLTGYSDGWENFDTTQNAKAAVDALVLSTFQDAIGINYAVYALNVFQFLIYAIIVWALFGGLIFALCKFKKLDVGSHFTQAMQLAGGFLLISGATAMLIGFVCNFFMAQSVAYSVGMVSLLAVFGIRTLVFIIVRLVNCKKAASDKNIMDKENI